MQLVRLDQIRTPADLPRRQSRITFFLELFQQQLAPLPPVRLKIDNDTYVLLDGIDQLVAARTMQLEFVNAIVEPRTRQQKLADAREFLAADYWRRSGTRQVMRYCHVGYLLIAPLLAELEQGARVGLDGKERRSILHTGGRQQRNRRKQDSIYLSRQPYLETDIPPGYCDVVVTVPPPVADPEARLLARQLRSHVQGNGSVYMIFTPDDTSALHTWKTALLRNNFPFGGQFCWKVNGPGRLPGYELILAMGYLDGDPFQVIRGPRSGKATGPDTLYHKPEWLARQLVKGRRSVLDPFVQSPFTLIAARQMGVESAIGCLLDETFRGGIEAVLEPSPK